MKRCILYLIICVCVCACKTQKPLIITEYRDRIERDTVTRVDTVYRARYVFEKGDTVFVNDTLFKYVYRDRVQDVYVHDSIPYTVEVPTPVRVRNGYDRFTSCGFWIFVLLLLIRLAWWVVKKYYLRL